MENDGSDHLPAAALRRALLGSPVFPCGPRKWPLTARGFHDASTDPEQVCAWWSRWPNALIGMPTGAASGLVVLDLDLKGGCDGAAAFEALGAERRSGRWSAPAPGGTTCICGRLRAGGCRAAPAALHPAWTCEATAATSSFPLRQAMPSPDARRLRSRPVGSSSCSIRHVRRRWFRRRGASKGALAGVSPGWCAWRPVRPRAVGTRSCSGRPAAWARQ